MDSPLPVLGYKLDPKNLRPSFERAFYFTGTSDNVVRGTRARCPGRQWNPLELIHHGTHHALTAFGVGGRRPLDARRFQVGWWQVRQSPPRVPSIAAAQRRGAHRVRFAERVRRGSGQVPEPQRSPAQKQRAPGRTSRRGLLRQRWRRRRCGRKNSRSKNTVSLLTITALRLRMLGTMRNTFHDLITPRPTNTLCTGRFTGVLVIFSPFPRSLVVDSRVILVKIYYANRKKKNIFKNIYFVFSKPMAFANFII